jgi:hypothetical protein
MSTASPPSSCGPPSSAPPSTGPWLTPECDLVQAEIVDLADALSVAALSEYPDLKTSLLRAIGDFRHHLDEHVREVEGAGGVFDYIVGGDLSVAPCVDCLCQEHRELEACLEELRQRLDGSVLTEPEALEGIRRCAARLKELIRTHHDTAKTLVREMRGGEGASKGDPS